ncbi:MAG: hypothetical protein AAF921_06075 [Cyanobacteria bacterium P01_D01_bin.44]
MTQPSSSNQLTAVSKERPSPESSQLVESYAEDLMDELFDDVDRILEGELPPATSNPFSSAQIPFGSTPLDLPAMIVPVAAVESTKASQPDSTEAKPQTRRWYKKRLPQIALGAACVSAIIALGVWLAKENASQPPTSAVQVETATAAPAPVSEEGAFLDYLNRSINIIQGQTSAQADVAQAGSVTPGNGLNRGTQTPVSRGPNVIERVFVPVFQPSQQTAVQSLPTLPAPGAAAPATAGNAAPLPTLAPQTGTPQATAPQRGTIPNISPVNTHVLVGVLELGERSAALFEINGASQRVYVGENIGASGWTIVSIANEEIVVRRNGEVRSVYIGQQF